LKTEPDKLEADPDRDLDFNFLDSVISHVFGLTSSDFKRLSELIFKFKNLECGRFDRIKKSFRQSSKTVLN
jgi:hypothetical protein